MDGVLGGVVSLATTVAVAAAVLAAVLYQRELRQRVRRLADRRWPPPEQAHGRPIERIARDARRLHAELRRVPPGTPAARRAGLVRAYDDLLAEACDSLGVDDTLSDADPRHRDVERLRVEDALVRAGLRLDD